MTSPSKGDFPVGQFDAQSLLPNGRGIPSFASSWLTRAEAKAWSTNIVTLPKFDL